MRAFWWLLVVPLAACDEKPAPPRTASATAVASSAPTAAAVDPNVAYARSLIGAFGPALKKELMQAMSAGGPTNAITVCSEKAPKIAEGLAVKEGWSIRRTSLKLRNPENAPDAWEKATLEQLERDKAKGKPLAELEISEVKDGEFRYMKAIGTDAMCLTCHGAELPQEVTSLLAEKYPDDAARGFSAGDIRGAFSIKKKL